MYSSSWNITPSSAFCLISPQKTPTSSAMPGASPVISEQNTQSVSASHIKANERGPSANVSTVLSTSSNRVLNVAKSVVYQYPNHIHPEAKPRLNKPLHFFHKAPCIVIRLGPPLITSNVLHIWAGFS